jgi:hypothetical protein
MVSAAIESNARTASIRFAEKLLIHMLLIGPYQVHRDATKIKVKEVLLGCAA